jgi:hypothetical protein
MNLSFLLWGNDSIKGSPIASRVPKTSDRGGLSQNTDLKEFTAILAGNKGRDNDAVLAISGHFDHRTSR